MSPERKNAATTTSSKPTKRSKNLPTKKPLPGSGSASQPFVVDTSQLSAAVTSTFESRLRNTQQPKDIVATEGSRAATVATADGDDTDDEDTVAEDPALSDDFDGIDWSRLPKYMKPLMTSKFKKSWVYKHSYRVALRSNPEQLFFICHVCFKSKRINNGGSGVYNTTFSTSTAARHLERKLLGHGFTAPGKKAKEDSQTPSLRSILKGGSIEVSQAVANTFGGFNCDDFHLEVDTWLFENNHPLRELKTPAFRRLIRKTNPEAEAALWTSHNSVSRYFMTLYDALLPVVKDELSGALSKIHISFNGWTTKGGKQGFLGIVAHYVSRDGKRTDLPIALPQLSGAHSGKNMDRVVSTSLQQFSITPCTISYFVLDNATNNDTAILYLSQKMGLNATHRRLRCTPHTINLMDRRCFGAKMLMCMITIPRTYRRLSRCVRGTTPGLSVSL
jgi:hypothetical protein